MPVVVAAGLVVVLLVVLLVVVPLAYAGYTRFSFRWRVVHPHRRDPAAWIVTAAIGVCAALVVLVVVANVAEFNASGDDVVFRTVLLDVAAAFGIVVLAVFLWEVAERRRRNAGYVITTVSYPHAPLKVQATMRRIYSSARSLRGGRAYQDGMFGDIELDALVYSAAERAVLCSELAWATRQLKGSGSADDRTAVGGAHKQLEEIRQYLDEVDATLQRAAVAAGRLSSRLTPPQRHEPATASRRPVARNAKKPEASSEVDRRTAARRKAEEAAARMDSHLHVDISGVEERVDAVAAGYDEAAGIATAAMRGPRLPKSEPVPAATPESGPQSTGQEEAGPTPPGGSDYRRAARDAVLRAAKRGARGTAKATVAGAKFGAEQARKRRAGGDDANAR